jgi:hypothetical protein
MADLPEQTLSDLLKDLSDFGRLAKSGQAAAELF